MLHGRLPADEKDAVMRAFAAGELDVLVATTVIEVGVDVPNATVMIVMDADRFGVSQLHQLRGRVGRGAAPGLCLLVTESAEGTRRRGSGSTRWRPRRTVSSWPSSTWSSGGRATCWARRSPASRSHLRLLSLLRDAKLITEARAEAIELIADDPDAEPASGAGRVGGRAGRRGTGGVPGEGLRGAPSGAPLGRSHITR